MKISIVTPSFNQAKYIRQTINSVLVDHNLDLQYIVMDGGSTDGTVSILRKYKKSEFLWRSERDAGQAAAINKGMRMATGDILGYINSDDYYEPEALHSVVLFFEKHPEVMWMTGDCRIVNEHGREIQPWVRLYKKLLRHFPLTIMLPIVNPIAQPSTFWRRDVLKTIGYFDESCRFAFDYDFWLRLIKRYPPTIQPETFSSFRIHEASKGGTEYAMQFGEELQVAARHTKNKLFLLLHSLHNKLIVSVYNTIKS